MAKCCHPERSEAESRDPLYLVNSHTRDFSQRLTSLWLASTRACPEYARGGRNDNYFVIRILTFIWYLPARLWREL